MPEASNHSKIKGKCNVWLVVYIDDGEGDSGWCAVLLALESDRVLLASPPHKEKKDAEAIVERVTSGNTMNRFG